MHRQIMGNPIGLEVDHKNHDGLDNQDDNLRICTHQENLFNKSKEKKSSSKYKGVSRVKNSSKWVARIRLNNKYESLGYYYSEVEAANAYNIAALERNKEFIYLNDININELQEAIEMSNIKNKNKPKYCGIQFYKNRWGCTIWDKQNKKSKYLGRFKTEEEAYNYQQKYLTIGEVTNG